jgi:hypothetical protein
MSGLAAWQRDFQSWLTRSCANAAGRLGDGAGLAIYQNTYRHQLLDCLSSAFPFVKRMIGDGPFSGLSIAHVEQHPPQSWTVDAYGAGFEKTIATFYPDRKELAELAWIEWAMGEAFVAIDADCVPLEATPVSWDDARLRLAPSLRCRAAHTNAFEIWSALVDEQDPPDACVLSQPAGYLVWRRDLTCYVREADAIDYRAVLRVMQDPSFAALCNFLVGELGLEDGVAKAGSLLRSWADAEIIIAVE